MTADPEALLPLVRNAGAVFCGPWAPAVRRRLRRRREPRAPDRPHRPVRQRAPGRHVPQARTRRRRRRGGARHASLRTSRALAAAEGLDRARRARSRCARRLVTRAEGQPRRCHRRCPRRATTCVALEGYHSPQLDVAVRLNTNESPYPPPPEFVDTWLAALRGGAAAPLPRPRRARAPRRRSARTSGSRSTGSSARTARTRCSRRCCSPTAAPGGARSCSSPRTRCTRHIARITGTEVVVGERARRLHGRSPTEAGALIAPSTRRRSCSCAAPTTRPARSSRARRSRRCSTPSRHGLACSSSTRPTASSRDWSALELVSRRPAARRGAHLLEGVVDGRAAARVLRSRRRGSSSELEKVVLPYHLVGATQLAGLTRARASTPRCDERVDALGRGARPPRRGAGAARPGSPSSRRARTSCSFRPDGDGHVVWERLVERGVLVRDFSRWPRLEGCLRVTVGTPEENDAFLAALRESSSRRSPPDVRRPRVRAAPRHEGDDDRSVARRRRQRRRHRRRRASRSSTTCSSSSASTAVSTCRSRRPATSRSTCTTPSRTSASCSAPR